MHKSSSLPLEFYHVVPIYDEYSDDDLDILELGVSMVTESYEKIHEDIQFIIYKQLESIYDTYAFDLSEE